MFCVRQHSNPVFSFLRVPLSAMKKFLATVDATPRDEGYLDRVVAALAANEVHIVEDLVGLDFGVLKEIPSGGVGAFIVRALRKANSLTASQPSQSAGPPVAAEALQSLLASVKTEPKPHVNLLDKLSRHHLGDLNASCLPDGEVVDDLEAEIRKLRKKGIAKPFVYVELAKFLPHWCLPNGEAPSEEEDDNVHLKAIAKAMGAPQKAKRPLGFIDWSIAFDRYMLAAAATDQWSFPAALAYKNVVLEVGMGASAKGRKPWLGVIYDEVARKDWSRKAYAGIEFDIDAASRVINEEFLLRAEKKFDQKVQERQATRSGAHQSWHQKSSDSRGHWGKHQQSWAGQWQPNKRHKY